MTVGPLLGAWMIKLGKARDREALISSAPALFTPEAKRESKEAVRKAARMCDMHARTES